MLFSVAILYKHLILMLPRFIIVIKELNAHNFDFITLQFLLVGAQKYCLPPVARYPSYATGFYIRMRKDLIILPSSFVIKMCRVYKSVITRAGGAG